MIRLRSALTGAMPRALRALGAPSGPRRVVPDLPECAAALSPDARIERVCGGFGFLEGPAWCGRSGRLVFSDIPANTLWQRIGRRVTPVRRPSGHANGNAFDSDGHLLTCEHSGRRVVRQTATGGLSVLAEQWDGKPLNSPNDVILGPEGTVLFTDPPFGLRGQGALGFSGVYAVARCGRLDLLTRALPGPNGLALSVSGDALLVADSLLKQLWRFPFDGADRLGRGACVFEMTDTAPGNPDGLVLDAQGHVFAAGPRGVWILSPAFRRLGLIELPERVSNLTWGRDGKDLLITATSTLYRVRCHVGQPLAGAP